MGYSTRASGSPLAPQGPGDQTWPQDHHVALGKEPIGVPACCQEPRDGVPFVRARRGGNSPACQIRNTFGSRSGVTGAIRRWDYATADRTKHLDTPRPVVREALEAASRARCLRRHPPDVMGSPLPAAFSPTYFAHTGRKTAPRNSQQIANGHECDSWPSAFLRWRERPLLRWDYSPNTARSPSGRSTAREGLGRTNPSVPGRSQ